MKVCDMCKEKIKDDVEIRLDSTICLGTEVTTYDLCRSCTFRVNKFILRAQKC